jgi:hypothetical protein
MRSAAKLALVLAGATALLAGCGPRHQFTRLENGDHTLVATIDFVQAGFGFTQNAVVSVQEKRGLASLVATFNNVQRVEVSWLGPEDLNICQVGQVIGYKTAVSLNTSTGLRTVHIRYGC